MKKHRQRRRRKEEQQRMKSMIIDGNVTLLSSRLRAQEKKSLSLPEHCSLYLSSLLSVAHRFLCQRLTLIICLYLFLSAIFKHEEKEGRLSNPARETERTTSEFLPVCYKMTVNDFRAIVSLVVPFHKSMPRTFASDVVLYS
jgi:hypothetical protein